MSFMHADPIDVQLDESYVGLSSHLCPLGFTQFGISASHNVMFDSHIALSGNYTT